jgi:hypothetical protein
MAGGGRDRVASRAGHSLAALFLICASFALIAAGTAAAAPTTRYVASDGSDFENDCTDSANPCLTVSHAVNQANDGDTIAVAGTHDETVTVRKSLTITGSAGGGPAVLDGSSAGGTPVVTVDGTDLVIPPVVTLSDLTVQNDDSGDGVLSEGGASVTVRDATISNNGDLGVRVATGSSATVENSAITSNLNTGVWVESGGSLIVENSTISHNGKSGLYDDGTATIARSTITANSSPVGGAAFVDTGGNLTVAMSTLSGNSSSNPGGALLNVGTATIEDSTIAQNSSTGGGAIATALNGSTTLAGDIVAKQTSGSDCSPVGGIVDRGYNLDDDGSCISHTTPAVGSHSGTAADGSSTYGAVLDAYLANALRDNGGPTQTLALLNNPSPPTTVADPALGVVPASFSLPAPIDGKTAACALPDQRGITPAIGLGCDVGAYLLQATRTSLASSHGTVAVGIPVTYTATITPAPDGGTVTFSDGAHGPASAHCGARPVTHGRATCTVSYSEAAVVSVTAAYSGDGALNRFAASRSTPPLRQAVTRARAPHLSDLHIKPHKFKAAAKGGAIAALRHTGTTISYRDTLAAHTVLRVYRKLRGTKRPVLVGTFSHRDAAGINKLHFTGRLHSKALPPGTYRLTLTASRAGRRSRTISGSFVITAR